MSGIRIYEPEQAGGGTIFIPRVPMTPRRGLLTSSYARQSGAGATLNIPVYRPYHNQSGGGFMRNVKNKMMIAASSIGRKAVKRGAEAVSNVIDNVIDGKDVKQALEDEKTKMRIDLQRKKQKLMEKS